MTLHYKSEADESGRRRVACDACGYERLTHWPISRIHHLCPSQTSVAVAAPICGPGTELEAILHAAGAKGECGGMCQWMRDQMNLWGVDRCRQYRQEIVGHLIAAAFRTWISEQVSIGWSIANQPWFRITDPIGSMVDEAIRRAAVAA